MADRSKWDALVSVAAMAIDGQRPPDPEASMAIDTPPQPTTARVVLKPHPGSDRGPIIRDVPAEDITVNTRYNYGGEWYALTAAGRSLYHGHHVASTLVTELEFRKWQTAKRFGGDYRSFAVSDRLRRTLEAYPALVDRLEIIYGDTSDFPVRFTHADTTMSPRTFVVPRSVIVGMKSRRCMTFAWRNRRYYPEQRLPDGSRVARFCRIEAYSHPPLAPTKSRRGSFTDRPTPPPPIRLYM